mmetsp:Transcript_103417/g.301727  ORF Transcript_103417/g.301727 Transcript_103417/m.301727 type:complete len:334 (-) Transcript_103417:465-1466(-)
MCSLGEVREVVVERASQQGLKTGTLGVAPHRVRRKGPNPVVLSHGVSHNADEQPQVLHATVLLLMPGAAVQQRAPTSGATWVNLPTWMPCARCGVGLWQHLDKDVCTGNMQWLKEPAIIHRNLEERPPHSQDLCSHALMAPPPLLVEAAERQGLLWGQPAKVEQKVRHAQACDILMGITRRPACKEVLLCILEPLPCPRMLIVGMSNDGRPGQRKPCARKRRGITSKDQPVAPSDTICMLLDPAVYFVLGSSVLLFRVRVETLIVKGIQLAEVARRQCHAGHATGPSQKLERRRARGSHTMTISATTDQATRASVGPEPRAEHLCAKDCEQGQ